MRQFFLKTGVFNSFFLLDLKARVRMTCAKITFCLSCHVVTAYLPTVLWGQASCWLQCRSRWHRQPLPCGLPAGGSPVVSGLLGNQWPLGEEGEHTLGHNSFQYCSKGLLDSVSYDLPEATGRLELAAFSVVTASATRDGYTHTAAVVTPDTQHSQQSRNNDIWLLTGLCRPLQVKFRSEQTVWHPEQPPRWMFTVHLIQKLV